MNEFAEAVKGFTDIPIALIAAILGILVLKKNKIVSALFFLVALTATLGTAVHVFAFSAKHKRIIWVFLYALIYECARVFSDLLIKSANIGISFRFTRAAEVTLYLCSVIFLVFVNRFDMLFFVLFAALCIALSLYSFIKARRFPPLVIIMLCLLITVAVLQALSGIIPFAVVFEHLFISAALFIAYRFLLYS